ncbi:MAG TPA: hypothetical protein VFS66_08250 [Acidimicrobiia bacterium]|nr:hypothetical protein [Acidimicrobiia bacterium]
MDTNFETIDRTTIFDDPVGYLACFGISAEVVAVTTLPVAA